MWFSDGACGEETRFIFEGILLLWKEIGIFGFLIGMWLYLHFGIKISSSYLSFTTITEFLHWDCVSSDFLVQVYQGIYRAGGREHNTLFAYFSFVLSPVTMSQSQWGLINTELIAGYAKTVIGRCMHPPKKDMKILLFMLPRIWQVEGGTCYWFWFGFGEKNIEIPARLAGYTIDWKQREIRVEGTRTTIKSERKSGLFKAGVSRSSPKSPLKSNS